MNGQFSCFAVVFLTPWGSHSFFEQLSSLKVGPITFANGSSRATIWQLLPFSVYHWWEIIFTSSMLPTVPHFNWMLSGISSLCVNAIPIPMQNPLPADLDNLHPEFLVIIAVHFTQTKCVCIKIWVCKLLNFCSSFFHDYFLSLNCCACVFW